MVTQIFIINIRGRKADVNTLKYFETRFWGNEPVKTGPRAGGRRSTGWGGARWQHLVQHHQQSTSSSSSSSSSTTSSSTFLIMRPWPDGRILKLQSWRPHRWGHCLLLLLSLYSPLILTVARLPVKWGQVGKKQNWQNENTCNTIAVHMKSYCGGYNQWSYPLTDWPTKTRTHAYMISYSDHWWI